MGPDVSRLAIVAAVSDRRIDLWVTGLTHFVRNICDSQRLPLQPNHAQAGRVSKSASPFGRGLFANGQTRRGER